jgi:hypothetical protein
MVRSTRWNGVKSGDVVVVDGVKERRQHWVFVAHVVNEATDAEWVEVRGGRVGGAKKGSRIVGLSLAQAPQLPIP